MSGKQTFFWYDLETSGTNPRGDRIMQFAGQRTDMDLNLVGEPVNLMIKLSDDILPQPDAVMITGITPQMTMQDGLTEVEFLKYFTTEVATPGTIFVGFNSVRFDDEFMRFLHYRNYYDAYSWQWRDGRGRWDLLDVVRMTRALRPNGIQWPVADGKSTNRLELLTKENGLSHEHAHDALSDVMACIEVAKLLKAQQPKLWQYLLDMRDKKKVAELVEKGEPFVYSSGKYDGEFEKTTVAIQISQHPTSQASLVYDLRHNPTQFVGLSVDELVERWRYNREVDAPKRLPVKTLQYNRCPAVAPLSVLDTESQGRLGIDMATVANHRQILRDNPDFVEKVTAALSKMDSQRSDYLSSKLSSVEERLYDGFVANEDQNLMSVMRAASPDEITDVGQDFKDERLQEMVLPYKARNFAASLTPEERATWEKHRFEVLMSGGVDSRLAKFMHRLQELANQSEGRADKQYLLEELQLYAESIMPTADF